MITKTFFAAALVACYTAQALDLQAEGKRGKKKQKNNNTTDDTRTQGRGGGGGGNGGNGNGGGGGGDDFTGTDLRDFSLNFDDSIWENKAQAPSIPGWFKGATYVAKSREDKMTDLWGMITESATVSAYPWAEFYKVFEQKSSGSFSQPSDEMVKTRVKINHRQGVVGKIDWVSTGDHGYTGIFETGSDSALIRFSETTFLTDFSGGLLPSMAIKFLTDGEKSQNIVAMPGFNSSSSWDFFHAPMSNRVEAFADNQTHEKATIEKKLAEASKWPFDMGISDVALYNQDGSSVSSNSISSPYKLEFTSDIHFPDEQQNGVMFYDQLMSIASGTVVMEAWAWDGPESDGGAKFKIADLMLTTPLTTSTFGDERLFFEHQKINNDRQLYADRRWRALDPEINDSSTNFDLSVWPQDDNEAAKEMFESQVEEYGCPFAWLLNMF